MRVIFEATVAARNGSLLARMCLNTLYQRQRGAKLYVKTFGEVVCIVISIKGIVPMRQTLIQMR